MSSLQGKKDSFAQVFVGYRDTLDFEEVELVKIAALEDNLVVLDVEKSAAAKTEGVAPFQDGPIARFVQGFFVAHHFRASKFDLEHLADGGAPDQGFCHHLVIGGVFRIKGHEAFDVGGVEEFDPVFYELGRSHGMRAFLSCIQVMRIVGACTLQIKKPQARE